MTFDMQKFCLSFWKFVWRVLRGVGTVIAIVIIVGWLFGFFSKLYELNAAEEEVVPMVREVTSTAKGHDFPRVKQVSQAEPSWSDETEMFQLTGSTATPRLDGVLGIKRVGKERRYHRPDKPVVMLKRVVYAEDLLGKWNVKGRGVESGNKEGESENGLVEFLPGHEYREIRVNRVPAEGGFEKEWVLECELKGNWIVKPERRTIIVRIESAVIRALEGWGERFANQYREERLQMVDMDIEVFSDSEMTLDVEAGPHLQLVRKR